MTDPDPIDADVDPQGREAPPGSPPSVVDTDTFRDALARWASTVTLVAVRDGEKVYATTVTSFAPVTADPPDIVVALGPNAQVLPFLLEGSRFVVNLLAEDQAGLASRYADSYPVGPAPFPASGNPVAAGAVASMVCRTVQVHRSDADARLVVGRIESVVEGAGGSPLLWYDRGPRRLADP